MNDSKSDLDSNAKGGKRGKKRGLKPRSQRNRKKSRGGVGLGSDEGSSGSQQEHHVQIDILPLPSCPIMEGSGDKHESTARNGGIQSTHREMSKVWKRIRVVRPYPFTFATFSKARWLNRKIIDVYHEEFGSYPRSYYESAIREGRILVSGKKVNLDYKIKGQDELTHTVHRHEPVVAIRDDDGINTCPTALSPTSRGNETSSEKLIKQSNQHHFPLISVIYEDEDIIVVDKPSTLPVHPSGGYNFNSLCHILSEQDPSLQGKLYNVHRLDRLTSGLTIVAKSTEVAKVLGKCVQDRENCHKIYLARVKGKFPLAASERANDLKVPSSFDQTQNNVNAVPCVNGEWVSTEHASKVDSDKPHEEITPSSESSPKKKSNDQDHGATCFWVSNEKGTIQHNTLLEDVFKTRTDLSQLSDDGVVVHSDDKSTLWLNLCVPCEIVCHKNGVCKAGKGKPAQTSFSVLAYDEDTDSTMLVVKPQTGRTHQIRLHLEYLGHPIANDPNYGGDLFYGDQRGKEICDYARERMKEIDKHMNKKESDCPDNATSVDTPATEMEVANAGMHKRIEGESLLNFIERTCVWCERSKGENRSVLEFLIRSQGIWLHAYQYSLLGPKGKIVHKTSLPRWSLIDNK